MGWKMRSADMKAHPLILLLQVAVFNNFLFVTLPAFPQRADSTEPILTLELAIARAFSANKFFWIIRKSASLPTMLRRQRYGRF